LSAEAESPRRAGVGQMDRSDVIRRWMPGPGPGRPGDLGLFPPGTVARRVNGETALLLGGPRALLMQLAHPSVAAGVADHSDFRRDALGRLTNTLDLTLTVAFGDAAQRGAALERVAATHRRVVGVRRGDPYRAVDPELLLWVHATLVDSALAVHERFVGHLDPRARAQYHEEMKRQALAFGVPADLLPLTFDDFRRYVDEMVATIEVSEEARELSRGVLAPSIPSALRPLLPIARLLTAALLPERLRAAYGLPWGPRRERACGMLAAGIRRAVPFLPQTWRRWPHARDADRRAAGRLSYLRVSSRARAVRAS
jgi:uncharacterized protein (DUF2236 family)